MPRRNLLVLVAVTLVALLCYQRVQKNPYGRVLADAMTTIENRYLEPVQASKLFERAMDGMVGKLDDNSAYITPADLQEFQQSIDLAVRRRGDGGGPGPADQATDGPQSAGRLSGVQGGHPRRRQDPADRRGQHPRNVAPRRRRPAARQARRCRSRSPCCTRAKKNRPRSRSSAARSRSTASGATRATPTAPGTSSSKATRGSATSASPVSPTRRPTSCSGRSSGSRRTTCAAWCSICATIRADTSTRRSTSATC